MLLLLPRRRRTVAPPRGGLTPLTRSLAARDDISTVNIKSRWHLRRHLYPPASHHCHASQTTRTTFTSCWGKRFHAVFIVHERKFDNNSCSQTATTTSRPVQKQQAGWPPSCILIYALRYLIPIAVCCYRWEEEIGRPHSLMTWILVLSWPSWVAELLRMRENHVKTEHLQTVLESQKRHNGACVCRVPCLTWLQVAEQQARMLERRCDVRLPAKYRDYVIVKRSYRLHAPEHVVSVVQVSWRETPTVWQSDMTWHTDSYSAKDDCNVSLQRKMKCCKAAKCTLKKVYDFFSGGLTPITLPLA